jgi:hypothetical protein
MTTTETDRDPFALARQGEDDDRDLICPTRSDAELAELVMADPEVQRCIKELAGIFRSLQEKEIAARPGQDDAELLALFTEYERVYALACEMTDDDRTQQFCDQACDLEEQIEAIRPATVPGGLKMLGRGLELSRDIDPPAAHPMIQAALAGLREMGARSANRVDVPRALPADEGDGDADLLALIVEHGRLENRANESSIDDDERAGVAMK